VEADAGLLTACELLELLTERGADPAAAAAHTRPALDSEAAVFEALRARGVKPMAPAALEAFCAAVAKFGLSRRELLQVADLRPAQPVELHLLLADVEGRLTDAQVARLLALVATHFG
jgi:hypothetical protein